MAVLSDHHWPDPIAGLAEMRRVARRVVVLQWDASRVHEFWLVRDHLAEAVALDRRGPSLAERAASIGASMTPVPVPWDCVDGFFHAYWRRPAAYLDEAVRRCTSVWAQVGPEAERRAVASLRAELESGAWPERNRELLELAEAELGLRLLAAG